QNGSKGEDTMDTFPTESYQYDSFTFDVSNNMTQLCLRLQHISVDSGSPVWIMIFINYQLAHLQ
ncbi:MAG: hypothetical protein LBB15_01045, partial [Puniceicoccales bacterium]|nr:hypothetical protein [Puniceicoccales bacterium]